MYEFKCYIMELQIPNHIEPKINNVAH